MKVVYRNFLQSIALSLFCLVSVSCKKENTNYSPPANNTSSQALKPFAGNDQILQLPFEFISLNGSHSAQSQIDRIHWQKLSGPSCIIDNQNALLTKVRGIQAGIYQFELTVFNKSNFPAKDTVMITLNRQTENITIGQNSHVFSSLPWIFPWYNSLEVKNIDSYVPKGVPMRVSVQRSSSTDWKVAYPVSSGSNNNNTYEYFIETRPNGAGMYNLGSLYIFYYGTDVNDSPKVKVEF